jgi:uncharacterized membrane protein (DUF373 family)
LSFYQKFEHAVILVLTALIAIVVALAVWNLVLKVLLSIMSSGGFDPTDYAVFQALFGMIFTVIIALEFKRSLLVVAERQHSVVQVRTVVLIALLAIVRKLMIIDLSAADAQQVLALAATILALGAVFWLVRDQDTQDVIAAKAEGTVSSVATLRPRPELAASEVDIVKMARLVDQAGSVVIMCGAGCHRFRRVAKLAAS